MVRNWYMFLMQTLIFSNVFSGYPYSLYVSVLHLLNSGKWSNWVWLVELLLVSTTHKPSSENSCLFFFIKCDRRVELIKLQQLIFFSNYFFLEKATEEYNQLKKEQQQKEMFIRYLGKIRSVIEMFFLSRCFTIKNLRRN